jgi:hypothetical protein
MEYTCSICKKEYSSYQSLWIHNKKFHLTDNKPVDKSNKPYDKSNDKPDSKKYQCSKCNTIFVHYQSRWKHEKKCTSDNTKEKKDEIIELKNKLEQLEKKVTKKVINNNSGTIYNGNVINNNITINKVGSENLSLLNDNEISMIFNKEIESITTFIELLNFNSRLPENHNYCTTSLESKFLSVYNKDTNTIEKDRKKYFFDKLLNSSVDRIQLLYNTNKNKFPKIKQKQIEANIKNLKSFKDYDFNNKILKEMINKMNLVTYNKKSIVQKTWHEDSDSEDDFQKDLNKDETKAEFYKKIEMKEKLALENQSSDEDSDSDISIQPKTKPKKHALINVNYDSSDNDE